MAGLSVWNHWMQQQNPWCANVAELWSNTPLFNNIPKKEIILLAQSMHPRQYKADESIFHVNDHGAGAAIIIKGQVEISTKGVPLALLGPGDFFGEISLVLDERRTADATALTESELAFFLRLDLEEWMARVPQHAATLNQNLARGLARRLQHANRLVGERVMQ